MRRTALTILALLAGMLALAGCGHTTRPQLTVLCPPGHSYMGCASGATRHPAHTQLLKHLTVTAPVPGCKFPDVSSYQGHPDWSAASRYICAGVAKAGEANFEDPDFAWNVSQLRALHIPWSGYFFVRGCSEGPEFVSILRSVGFKGDRDALRPVLDMEVPSAAGCAVAIAGSVHAALGLWPIIYTAPGTWPGGSSGGLNVWEADYGPNLASLPFAGTVLAWQRYSPPFTDYYIPGLGTQDVSIDLRGFSKALAFPVTGPTRAQLTRWRGARNASFTAYRHARCTLALHGRCKLYGGRVLYFQGRLWTGEPRWACFGKHARAQTAVCWIVRPLANYDSHAAFATQQAYTRNTCDGPQGLPSPSRSPLCDTLRQRERWFHQRASALVRSYG